MRLQRAAANFHSSAPQSSKVPESKQTHELKSSDKNLSQESASQKKKKTWAQMDEELRAAMEGRAGDGGLAGAELEGGKAVAMKRGVRDNMFRYI